MMWYVEEAKEEVEEVVEFLRDPKKFSRLGGKIPRGCLLVGPPELKTLLARAIAGSGSSFLQFLVLPCRNVCWSWSFKSKRYV